MTSKPYDPILTATCVANLAHGLGEPIYHTKLQRVLIYLNTEYIENYGVKLVDDTLVIREYGPVFLKVYEEYKNYYLEPIPYREEATLLRVAKDNEEATLLDNFVQYEYNYKSISVHDKWRIIKMLIDLQGVDIIKVIKDVRNLVNDEEKYGDYIIENITNGNFRKDIYIKECQCYLIDSDGALVE